MKLNVDVSAIRVHNEKNLIETAKGAYTQLVSGDMDNTGWVKLPFNTDKVTVDDILETADKISKKCTLFIVIGAGGSFLGAKAVIDALNGSKTGYPEVIFAGFNMSGAYLHKVAARMQHESVCLCIISKSGTTTEPLLTYSILQQRLIEKYGRKEAEKRIYIITDKSKGKLRQEANEDGIKSFVVPDDVGGRYSVLSSVGLLPIAVAGHNIKTLLKGASEIALSERWDDDLFAYTVSRVSLQQQGKLVEVFEFFEMNLNSFGEWLKQLFCESEGKDGQGVYTTYLSFSRDLHSVGQFLQEGSQIFYETLIRIKEPEHDFIIPESAGQLYAGKSLEKINDCAEEAVINAHKKAGIPIMTIEIPALDEYNIGQLIYFFEMSCAVSALIMGVNPFNQPGVEAYKSEMRRLVEELKI